MDGIDANWAIYRLFGLAFSSVYEKIYKGADLEKQLIYPLYIIAKIGKMMRLEVESG